MLSVVHRYMNLVGPKQVHGKCKYLAGSRDNKPFLKFMIFN